MKYYQILIFLIYLFTINQSKGIAQVQEPVKWVYSVKQLSKSEALLIFDAKIEPRWHLYSQYFPEGGPVRLSFNFKDSKEFKKVGKITESPKPKIVHDDVFEIDVQYFEGKASFRQKIKILSESNFVIQGEFEYQVCFDDKCVLFNPEFEFKVPGTKN